MSKDYVVVTTLSQFRHRYVMHKDDLQKLYPDYELDAIEWACDTVKEEKVEEFSQYWLGETIAEAETVTENGMLELFDLENDYLGSWTRKEKIDWARKRMKGKDAHG